MKGKVYLIGAGPGDYKLITMKGLECIKKAHVIVYDRLASPKLLQYRKPDSKLIYVGKESKNHVKTQDEINEIICQEAKQGNIVARLKGGDPYVFGRGGEEAQYLLSNNVEFEVVPGITSAIGGLAYGGIPITHRNYASSFHVITGHLKDDDKELDWQVLSKLKGTMVFLMGMSELKNITENLMKYDMPADTPVGIVHWATTDKQKVVTGQLNDIVRITQEKNIKNPSLIVVGQVVNLREQLNFHEKKPLYGKNILVTRSREQSSKLSDIIYDLGGNPVEFPTIKIKDLSGQDNITEEIRKVKEYNYLVFTSQNGVKIFMNRLLTLGGDIRDLRDVKIAVIGNATAKELENYYIKADVIPKEYIAESLFNELKNIVKKEDRILIPRAKETRDFLVDSLSDLCCVTELKIYETLMGDTGELKNKVVEMFEEGKMDYITFTSSSTVKNLFSMLDERLDLFNKSKMISIGPITSDTVRTLGMTVYKEAEQYDIQGLVSVLTNDNKEC